MPSLGIPTSEPREPELTITLRDLREQVSQSQQWANSLFQSVNLIRRFPEEKEGNEIEPLVEPADIIGQIYNEIRKLNDANLLLQRTCQHIYTIVGT